MWVADELPADLGSLWRGATEQHAATGLLPLLCPPGHPATPGEAARADEIRLDAELAAGFAAYRRERLPYWSDPTPPDDTPEGVEPWPHDPGPPFESWPGFAPAVPAAGGSGLSAVEAAAQVASHTAASGWHSQCRLALVPARRAADLPAALDWSPEAPVPLLCALLRSWEDRFGAQPVCITESGLVVSVARPPCRLQDAEVLAVEHVLTTADSIVDDPPTPFPEYAAGLVGRHDWWFWWD